MNRTDNSNYNNNNMMNSGRISPSMVSLEGSDQCNTERAEDPERPVRVRDMINLYNLATEKNHELSHAKSLYFGEGKVGGSVGAKDLDSNSAEVEQCEDVFCHMSENMSTTGQQGYRSCQSQGGKASVLESSDPGLDIDQAVGKSYQSRTTIRRIEQGVRIIIDIFFDKKTTLNIMGSRVETEIPESRILADFQQLSMDQPNTDN